MYIRFITLLVLAVPVFLTGCATDRILKEGDVLAGGAPVGGTSGNLPIVSNKRGDLVAQAASGQAENLIPSNPLATKVILFEFDSSTIRPSFEPILLAHSQHLTANAQTQVTLEGHADERGTREYNLALGEQRALTVKQFLMDHGVAENQLQTLSYGEERPADAGENQAAWTKNRRVELAY